VYRYDAILKLFALVAAFGKTTGFDHRAPDSALGAFPQHLRDEFRRYKNDCQIHRIRDLQNGGVTGQSVYFRIWVFSTAPWSIAPKPEAVAPAFGPGQRLYR